MPDISTNLPTKSKELLSGREIIQDFVFMLPGSLEKYRQLCSVLNTFELWSEESRVSFLRQFLDSYDLLDVNCSELVLKLSKIRWNTVPSQMLSDFSDFLCALAINHVHHINAVFNSFVDHFLPICDTKDQLDPEACHSPALVDQHYQESLYALAHLCIRNVVSCNPLSIHLLLKCFVKRFPHIKQPTPKLLAFMRNLIQFSDWIQDEGISAEIWSLIVEKLLHIDALSSDHQKEEQRFSDELPNKKFYKQLIGGDINPMEEKLNNLIEFILNYLGDGDTSKVTVIREEDRTLFFKMMRRFSSAKLQSITANEGGNKLEDVDNIPVEEGYEEELMVMR